MEAILIALSMVAPPADNDFYLTASGSRALVPFLGSEDPRWSRTVGLAYGQNNRRLRFRNTPGRLFVEGYYERSGSPGASQQPPNQTDAYGVVTYARYRSGRLFFDIGWGIQYTDQRTVDISSRLSSTPIGSMGVAFQTGQSEILAGLRFIHISNAGLGGNNQGSNQLGFFVSMGF